MHFSMYIVNFIYVRMCQYAYNVDKYISMLQYLRPGKIDLQFIVTARITPNTTASSVIILLQFLTDILIFDNFVSKKWNSFGND